MSAPQEMMFQNQLQFNLHVPLATRNIATHFKHPAPITIERVAAAGPGLGVLRVTNKAVAGEHALKDLTELDDFQFRALPQDKMAMAVQLAQRELKNKKLNLLRMQQRSPSPDEKQLQPPAIPGAKFWARQRSRRPGKVPSQRSMASRGSSRTMAVKEHDRNRAPHNMASQTPPSSPPRMAFINTQTALHRDKSETSQKETDRSSSPPTRDTPSMSRLAGAPTDDIEKLQLDMELYFQQIESVQKRLLSERNTDFLRPRRSRSSELLDEEEEEGRRQLRTNEQSHRALRTIYNLRQQLKEMEQQILKMPRGSRATKKSQASQRLTFVTKGAVKLLQAFVSQLPQQDLSRGLPPHFAELSNLVRQVTLLSAGVAKGAVPENRELSPVESGLMAMVDQVEKLNQEWQREIENIKPTKTAEQQKPPFVTNFKKSNPVKTALIKEHVFPPQRGDKSVEEAWFEERKAALKAGIQALLKAQRQTASSSCHPSLLNSLKMDMPSRRHRPSLKKMPMRKPIPARRGFLLSQKMRQQQISQAYGQPLPSHFADPTVTANLKASTMLYNPVTKPHRGSEPSSPSRDRKHVNFVEGLQMGDSGNYASFPGAGRNQHRLLTTGHRLRHSGSPSSPSLDSLSLDRGFHSDSECSPFPSFGSSDEGSVKNPVFFQDVRGTQSLPRPRSASPSGRATGQGRSPRRKSPSPKATRRRFFVADADPDFVEDMCLENETMEQRVSSSVQQQQHSRRGQQEKTAHKTLRTASLRSEDEINEMADDFVDETICDATQAFSELEKEAAVGERAQAHLTNLSLETIWQALERMERENEQLRQRYSSIKFHDSAQTRRRYQKPSEVFAEFMLNDHPKDPPSFEVKNTRPQAADPPEMLRVFTDELSHDPLIFTKDSKDYRSHIQYCEHDGTLVSNHQPPAAKAAAGVIQPKRLLSMKQTVVERIEDVVEHFDYYQRGLKQHLGKRDPFDVYERVADEILKQCCQEVAAELEAINSDMAEHIYTSEFLNENGLPLAPPQLAQDFQTGGTAARNLRDSAMAQHSVDMAVSRTVTSLMLPAADDAEQPPATLAEAEKRVGDDSPPWETSLKNVYDATALFEESVTDEAGGKEKKGEPRSKSGISKDTTQDDDEKYDYDDDYTDISDEEEDQTEEEGTDISL